ncbi:ShlB/FhaC/HecB family hemolysin secretion/activation protein [Pseudomonas psychrophila]|uniref:ShlB/FhaC/HecB family hemolysin secretion/activation protein n=1 Tax=Pseudomonas psychrophila TaxID=122355 RepID=UPI0037F4E7B1
MSVCHLGMRSLFLVLLGCLAQQGFAVAASMPTPGDQDLIRDRQERLLEEQRRRLEALQELPGKQISPTTPAREAGSRCFPIKDIQLKGADSLSARERESVLKPYKGQCLGVPQLNELLKFISNHYIDRGLVTSRAYLPQQDLSKGHLQVLVVEGKLESFKSSDNSGLSNRELAMVFPGQDGSQLNLREIEQAIDQLNRLPSNKAQMELAPGSEVGGSTVLVKNDPQQLWSASLSRNNDGQKSTGEQQWGTGFEWDSPLGLADQLVLRGGHDALSDRLKTSKSAMLYYNVPWGWWNFSYAYSQSDYSSVAQGHGFDFKQSGDSANHQLRAERVVHRDAMSKTSLNTGLAHMRSNNYVTDSRLRNSSHRLSEFQVGINHGRRIANAFVNLDVGMQNGIGAFDAQSSHNPKRGMPNARYRKYTATLSYLQPFKLWGESFSFTSMATGQRSEDVLFSPQRMATLPTSSSTKSTVAAPASCAATPKWRGNRPR